MNIGSVLVNFVLDTLWVWAFGLAILLLLRTAKGRPLFTDKHWLALCRHSRADVFSRRLLVRFFNLLLLVIAVGLAIGQWAAPLDPWWVIGSLLPPASKFLPYLSKDLQ